MLVSTPERPAVPAAAQPDRAAPADPGGRPRLLVAPVPITPTKPLMPSHVKCHLCLDMLVRASAQLATVEHLHMHTAGNACQQTLGFWEFLDRECGDLDHASLSETDIGGLYLRYHGAEKASRAALLPYLRSYEQSCWVHPASAAMLRHWSAHFERLGMRDPGLCAPKPARMSTEEVIDLLCANRLCVDARPGGGGVYLDNTARGLPLRIMVEESGLPNYMMLLLRDLVPRATEYDEILLMHDEEITTDYVQLHKTLESLGARVSRMSFSRVGIGGVVRSSRHGDWAGHTVPDIMDAALEGASLDAVKLGLRIYYVSVIGKGSGKSFDAAALSKCVRRAGQLLAREEAPDAPDYRTWLSGYVNRGGLYPDPYRLATALLDRGRPLPLRQLLEDVFL